MGCEGKRVLIAPDIVLVIKHITSKLDNLGIAYIIGGSIGSSALGKYRLTNDIDLVVDIAYGQISPFVQEFRAEYYVEPDTLRSAVEHLSTFSILHLESMVKADFFVKERSQWSDSVWNRRKIIRMESPDAIVDVYVPSAEDMILQKLRWYRLGREVSDRQWSDVLGVLEVQAELIDSAYLQFWAKNLGISDLLSRALTELGI